MGVLPDSWILPAVTDANRVWFTSGALAVQRCEACGTLQHPPEEICHHCGSMDLGTRKLSPRGTIHSYTVVHYAAHRALADHVPYVVVLVSLDDAPHLRVVGNLDAAEARIGRPVEAYWERRQVDGDEILLPQWRPAALA